MFEEEIEGNDPLFDMKEEIIEEILFGYNYSFEHGYWVGDNWVKEKDEYYYTSGEIILKFTIYNLNERDFETLIEKVKNKVDKWRLDTAVSFTTENSKYIIFVECA